jgi:hypothetical protein
MMHSKGDGGIKKDLMENQEEDKKDRLTPVEN